MHNRSSWTFIERCGRILRPGRNKRRLQVGSGCVGGGGGWARSEDLASNSHKQGFGDAHDLVLSPFVKNLEFTMIHISHLGSTCMVQSATKTLDGEWKTQTDAAANL